jgi:hypothetical protein
MAMPTIRIDDEVYDWLKDQAEAFVDTPNSVLRRLSGLDETDSEAAEDDDDRARPGELLDRKEYDEPILRVLAAGFDGAGAANRVVDLVGEELGDRLTEKDWTHNRSGVIRWRNRVMWRRFVLVKQGLLKADSPRGIWELTKEGWEASGVDGSPYDD